MAATERLAVRLADAYGLRTEDARTAVASLGTGIAGLEGISFERHGGDVLLVHGGEVMATLALGGLLPAIAPACDTLDPYGDCDDLPLRQTPAGRHMA